MAYSDFTLGDLESKFGIRNQRKRLFYAIDPVEPSPKLRAELLEIEEMPIRSEKAKSEWIVVPILKALRQRNDRFFTIYSGENLLSDEARGLKGECDFILAKETGSFDISFPILPIVEAKKNDLEGGIPSARLSWSVPGSLARRKECASKSCTAASPPATTGFS
jgi:hypothetical protein